MKNKIYLIAMDGAADWKNKTLDNQTPLEAANTKYLDQMVQKGQMSQITILENGITPESDSGAMALLGYPPEEYYCGRGTLECIGLGTYKKYRYFVGFRINFASFNQMKGTLDRRTARDISSSELQELTNEIIEKVSLEKWGDVHFELKTFGKFRGILAFYSNKQKLSGNVSNTDPGFTKKGRFGVPIKNYDAKVQTCMPLDETLEAKLTACIVNDFTEQCEVILGASCVNEKRLQKQKMPANCILIRDGGSIPNDMPLFFQKYNKSLAVYGQLPCEKAITELIGGVFYYTEAFELQLEASYLQKLARELKSENADVVFCHLKGPDEPGHDGKPFEKKRAIEIIDEYFFSELWEPESSNVYIVTCDHATPCDLGLHSSDKVPLLITGGCIQTDNTYHFDECNASVGKCKIKKATDILKNVIMERVYV